MNHQDHVNLLREGGIQTGQTWADLGAGGGAFTLAIADLMGDSGILYAIDRDGGALRQQAGEMRTRFPKIAVTYQVADFTRPLTLTHLDGIVMANSLHFVANQSAALKQIKSYLRPGGRLLIVEYNSDQANMWVPHPFSYRTWVQMAENAGFQTTRQIAARPSRFMGEIYAALNL
jgi:ubiquinone/menaquinone biosynthesis C-methylase UbiE